MNQKKRGKVKRFLSAMLIAVMVLSAVPADGLALTAFAEGTYVASVTVGDGEPAYYSSFDAAWKAATDADSATITLLADVALARGQYMEVAEGDVITLNSATDGSGNTYTISGSYTGVIYVNGGSFTLESGRIYGVERGVSVDNDGILTVTGGEIAVQDDGSKYIYGVYMENFRGTGSSIINMQGGKITASSSASSVYVAYGIYMTEPTRAAISGGEIAVQGNYARGIYVDKNSIAAISGGKITVDGNTSAYGAQVLRESQLEISGSAEIASNKYGVYSYLESSRTTVTGGKVSGGIGGLYVSGSSKDELSNVNLSGGTFVGGTNSISSAVGGVQDLLADGYAYYEGESVAPDSVPISEGLDSASLDSGPYTVFLAPQTAATVTIGENTTVYRYREGGIYTTAVQAFNAAWEAAKAGTAAEPATVTLLQNVELDRGTLEVPENSGMLEVPEGSSIILEGGDYTLSSNEIMLLEVTGGSFTLANGTLSGTADGGRTVTVSAGSAVINGGTILNEKCCGVYVMGDGHAEITDGTIRANSCIQMMDTAAVTISGGTITSTSADGQAIWVYQNSEVVITGGEISGISGIMIWGGSVAVSGNAEIISTGGAGDNSAGIWVMNSSGSVNITGGEISGESYGVYVYNGSVSFSGGEVSGKYGLYLDDGSAALSGGTFTGTSASVRNNISDGTVEDFLTGGCAYFKGTTVSEETRVSDADVLARDMLRASDGYDTVLVAQIPLKIIGQPADATVMYGEAATLSVTAEAAETGKAVSYQWYQTDGSGSTKIDGAVSAVYTVESGTDAGSYAYYCVVTCDGYAVTSNTAAVTVNQVVSVCGAPVGLTVEYGEALSNVTLTNLEGNTPGVWAWEDGAYVVEDTVGEHSYAAVFTPADTHNYTTETVNVTVNVVDTQAPSGEIILGTDVWKTLLNDITFGKFFKNTQSVTINGTDNYPVAVTVEYLLADSAQTAEELRDAAWTAYTRVISVELGKYVIYARITDASGNVTVINSDGIVIYTESSVGTDSITCTYHEGNAKTVAVELNGNTVKAVVNGAAVLVPGTDYTVSGENIILTADYLDSLNAGEYTLTVSYNPQDVETEKVSLHTEIRLTVEKVMIEDISDTVNSVSVPEALAEVQNTVTAGNGYTAAIAWGTGAESYDFNTTYTAVLTLTPDENYEFADTLTGADGWTVTKADGIVTLTRAFAKTRMEKLESVHEAPEDVSLTVPRADAASVIAELPAAVRVNLEANGTADLEIQWSCEDYSIAPNAENSFTWTVPESATDNLYDRNGVTLNGSITVTNPNALPVIITVNEDRTTVTYDGSVIDLTGLFTIDENAGAAGYTVTDGTGEGTQDGAELTVTRAGTFTVTVNTAAQGIYGEGIQTAILTVNKGAGTGTVTIKGWTCGDAPNAPVPVSTTNGTDSVSYQYKSADGKFSSENPPADAGSYQVTAIFAENDLYKACSAVAGFTIAAKEVPDDKTPGINITLSDAQREIMEKLGVSAETAAKILEMAEQYNVSRKTLLTTENDIQSLTTEEAAASMFHVLCAQSLKQTKKSVTVRWKKVSGADGYLIYGRECISKNSYVRMDDVSAKKTSFTQKKLKKATKYRYIVVAYRVVDGKKVSIAVSRIVHVTTAGGKCGVAKSLKVNKSKVVLKTGKSFRIKAEEINKTKKVQFHRRVWFESSDARIAAVNLKTGVIRAKKKGTCTIFVYAQNGIYKQIKVTVK